MVAAAVAAAALACTPQPGLGTVTYLRGTVQHRADLATCRDRVLKTGVTLPAQRAFATADGLLSATIRTTGRLRTLRETIWVTDRRTGRSKPVYSAKTCCDTSGLTSPGPIELLRWSGNDRWIFFAIDPGGSGSIAADGLILRVVSANGGSAHRLPVMLSWSNYLTWCGGRLVFIAGSDRVAIHHKQLDVAAPPDWRARPLAHAPDRAWGALACAPDQRSVVVQTQPESDDAGFFHTHWSLWRVRLDGSYKPLTFPPAHHADESPRFSRDGKTILFVRARNGDGELYALRSGGVVGPLLSLGHQDGFYGHQDWWSVADWSLAAKNQ